MNIKGRSRGAPRNLANHVQKDENEQVWIIGIHDLMAQDIDGALMEMDALGAGLKTSKTLYHMQISPAPTDPAMTREQIDYAVTTALKKLDLDNQPHIVIGHLKTGESGIRREHYHVIASRTDLEHNRAISDSHNYRKHEEAAREIERTLGHERVQGAHVERFGIERPDRTPSAAEMRQTERGAVPAKEAKALGAEIWATTDSGKTISAALEEHGWQLARGDKQRKDGGAYFMAVDPHGHAHELRRMVPVKAAELYERMTDIDPAMLPSVSAAKEMQQAHAEFRRDLAEWARQAGQEKAADPSRAETAPEAVQQREASAASSAPETSNTHTTERESTAEEIFFREARPASETPRVIHLGSSTPGMDYEREQQIIAEARSEMRDALDVGKRAAHAVSGFVTEIGDRMGSMIEAAADMLFPAAPPTKEEVQGKQRAAEEQERRIDGVRSKAEQEAALQELLRQMARDDAQARLRRERGEDRDDDYGRGRERERSR